MLPGDTWEVPGRASFPQGCAARTRVGIRAGTGVGEGELQPHGLEATVPPRSLVTLD